MSAVPAAALLPRVLHTRETIDLEGRVARLETEVGSLKALLGLPDDTPLPAPVRAALPFGNPGGPGQLLPKEYYTILHHSSGKIPIWVAYHLTRQNLEGTAGRTDDARRDPALSPGKRAELSDHRHSGYDRGHMAPAAAFKRGRVAMSKTFLFSDVSPQRPHLKRRISARLEADAGSLARAHESVWVFTGSFSMDADSLPVEPPDLIGTYRVGVPTHCYKVILGEHGTGAREMFAFIMENSPHPIPGFLSDYVVSMDAVSFQASSS